MESTSDLQMAVSKWTKWFFFFLKREVSWKVDSKKRDPKRQGLYMFCNNLSFDCCQFCCLTLGSMWWGISKVFTSPCPPPVVISAVAATGAKSLQSCLTLCDPIDSSPPGSPVPGILQARILEWVAISFSSAWRWEVKVKSLSPVQLWATSWTAAYWAPPSMGFSRQEHWSGVPSPSPISAVRWH